MSTVDIYPSTGLIPSIYVLHTYNYTVFPSGKTETKEHNWHPSLQTALAASLSVNSNKCIKTAIGF